MMEQDNSIKLLIKELWNILVADGGENIREMLAMKKREDRRGRIKRLLCRAIDKSSLGVFGMRMYHFGGQVYVPIDVRAFHKVLYDIMANRMEVMDADLVKLSDIYCDCVNSVYSKSLPVSNNIMIFRNGVLDVENNTFAKKFDKKYVQMWSVDYDYEPGMKTFLWHQFINQVLPEKCWQEALQMFLGATFIDRSKVKIENILILLGKGSNGKSVIQNVVCGVLGTEYVGQFEIGRLCASGNEGDMSVAEINGKRLNYCTEMEESDFYKKSARLKALVSGENVTARHLFGSPFKATNIPLLMANANRLPAFNKRDAAMLRRLYVIPFEVTIPEEKQNKTLGEELKAEYSGILNWILEGRELFIKNGYRLPSDFSLDKFLDSDAMEFNSVMKFMSTRGWHNKIEGVNVEPFTWIRLADMYAAYTRWCTLNHLEAVGKTIFSHTISNDLGYRKERKNNGYCVAVYGKDIEAIERQVRRDYGVRKKADLLWYDGVGYATTMVMLAKFAGVSKHVVARLNNEGKFDDCKKALKNKDVYDVKACIAVMKRIHVIATDNERDALYRIAQDLRYRRTLFNIRMQNRGWPYRMYDNDKPQLEEGIIVVSDYTTDEEVIRMAEAAGFNMGCLRGAYGAYSQGGKGTQKKREDIPTDKETKKLIGRTIPKK